MLRLSILSYRGVRATPIARKFEMTSAARLFTNAQDGVACGHSDMGNGPANRRAADGAISRRRRRARRRTFSCKSKAQPRDVIFDISVAKLAELLATLGCLSTLWPIKRSWLSWGYLLENA